MDAEHDTATQRRAFQSWLESLAARPSDPETSVEAFDAAVRTAVARLTRGLSPVSVALAYLDWLAHLAISPARAARLAASVCSKCVALGLYNAAELLGVDAGSPAQIRDRRHRGERWQRWPFSVLAQGHELARSVTRELTRGVAGVRPAHAALVEFIAGQIVELLAPANFPLTNPEVVETTMTERGANLARGVRNFAADLRRKRAGELPAGTETHRVGVNIGITPGKVIYENELIELIQYAPTTATVAAEPVVIVPAWIMKYYILDLSPHNSLVKYLRDHGKTVFILSWKNPDARDHALAMNDYLRRGVMTALDAVESVTGAGQIHAVGYCLGGTLLTIAAAWMAREGDERLATLSTFASQIDFTEAGEITMFLDESTLTFVEARMRERGYLDIESMVDAFRSLRAGQLVYAPAVERYLLGRDVELSDLMAWNVDGTRMPHRMHAEYLRRCYLDNDLAEARYVVDGRPVCVGDIRVPAFVLGTLTDHVAPWQSVYKAHRLLHGELTFALTTAGHNAGIVSGPSHPRRRYQLRQRQPGEPYIDPATWRATTPTREGSWWPAWNAWLDARTSATREPPPMGAPEQGYEVLRDAPGRYVHG